MTRRPATRRDRAPGWSPPRIITGTARGRRLYCPPDPRVRPATNRVKEALFNILFDVDGCNCLDLFAGCGSIGLEALSRGALHCTFVEGHGPAIHAIRRNLDLCRLADRATVVASDVMDWLERTPLTGRHAPWDLVFVDPPYDLAIASLARIAAGLSTPGMLTSRARIVFERRTGDEVPPLPTGCELRLQRAYGQTTLFLAEHAL